VSLPPDPRKVAEVFLVHEDRAVNLPGLRVTVDSLLRAHSAATVWVSGPDPEVVETLWGDDPRVQAWAPDLRGSGWDVKPELLLLALEAAERVVWIDADVLVSRSPAEAFTRFRPDVLVVSQETWWSRDQGTDVRTTGWGWTPARRFERSVNTGVVRVVRRHRELLEAWREAMTEPRYLQAQALPAHERPTHLIGDQEVLSGLLCSSRFAAMDVGFLEAGRDIAQCFGASGYTVGERLRTVRSTPVFYHAMGGPKPWVGAGRSGLLQRRLPELGDYRTAHRRLGLGYAPPAWAGTGSRLGYALSKAAAHNPAVVGLVPALPEELNRRSRQALGRLRRRLARVRGAAG
jgi:hypothetical protein